MLTLQKLIWERDSPLASVTSQSAPFDGQKNSRACLLTVCVCVLEKERDVLPENKAESLSMAGVSEDCYSLRVSQCLTSQGHEEVLGLPKCLS